VLREKLELLVGWVEEHEESLRQRQAAWHKDVKDQVFADHGEITVKRWIRLPQSLF